MYRLSEGKVEFTSLRDNVGSSEEQGKSESLNYLEKFHKFSSLFNQITWFPLTLRLSLALVFCITCHLQTTTRGVPKNNEDMEGNWQVKVKENPTHPELSLPLVCVFVI